MRSLWAVWILLLGLQLTAAPAAADLEDERRAREGARWIPSASLFTMGIPDLRSAQASSDTSGFRDGESTGFPWSVGVSLELASPVIVEGPGRPRIFVHGDFGYAIDTEEPVLTSGDPGKRPVSTGGAVASVEAIENVGSAIRVEAKPLVLSGGVGTVLSFEAFGRDYRLRPSLEWMYRRDSMSTVLGGGENEVAGSACGPCRTLFVQAQREKGYHSLGPGIELEIDAVRSGDFLLGFYGSFRAYRILGDRKADLVTRGSWVRTDGQPTTRADTIFRTRYDREPWHYRFGLGVRLLWSPE